MKIEEKNFLFSFGDVKTYIEFDGYAIRKMDHILMKMEGLLLNKTVKITNLATNATLSFIVRTLPVYVDLQYILDVGNGQYNLSINGEVKRIRLFTVSEGKSFPNDLPATKRYYYLSASDELPSISIFVPTACTLSGNGFTQALAVGYNTLIITPNMPKQLQIHSTTDSYNPAAEDIYHYNNLRVNIEIVRECLRNKDSVAIFYHNAHGEKTVIIGQRVTATIARESEEYRRFSMSYKNMMANTTPQITETIDLVFVTEEPQRVRDLLLNTTVTLSNNNGTVEAAVVDGEIETHNAGQMAEYRLSFKILG